MEKWHIIFTKYFSIEDGDFIINDFRLGYFPDYKTIDDYFNNPTIWKVVGTQFKRKIKDEILFVEHSVIDSEKWPAINFTNYYFIKDFMSFLWLVKDNSSNITDAYQLIDDKKIDQIGFTSLDKDKSKVFYSNASGRYTHTVFNIDEIKQANEYFEKYLNINNEYSDRLKNIENAKKIRSPKVKFDTWNRIERAYYYVGAARDSIYMPLKISNYVYSLECLFSDDNVNETQHRLAERIANYIGGTKQEKIANFKKFKYYYNIRSRFAHGQQLEDKFNTIESLIEISNELDQVCRIIIQRILNGDSHLFLKDLNDIKDWFLELVMHDDELIVDE